MVVATGSAPDHLRRKESCNGGASRSAHKRQIRGGLRYSGRLALKGFYSSPQFEISLVEKPEFQAFFLPEGQLCGVAAGCAIYSFSRTRPGYKGANESIIDDEILFLPRRSSPARV